VVALDAVVTYERIVTHQRADVKQVDPTASRRINISTDGRYYDSNRVRVIGILSASSGPVGPSWRTASLNVWPDRNTPLGRLTEAGSSARSAFRTLSANRPPRVLSRALHTVPNPPRRIVWMISNSPNLHGSGFEWAIALVVLTAVFPQMGEVVRVHDSQKRYNRPRCRLHDQDIAGGTNACRGSDPTRLNGYVSDRNRTLTVCAPARGPEPVTCRNCPIPGRTSPMVRKGSAPQYVGADSCAPLTVYGLQ